MAGTFNILFSTKTVWFAVIPFPTKITPYYAIFLLQRDLLLGHHLP